MAPGLAVACLIAAAAAAPALPMTGADKLDPWGVPIRTADKVALRRMLFDRRFAELTAALEGLQAISDKECQRELVGLDAFESFQSADPDLETLLNDWVEASPDSYAPLVARGTWWVAMAQERRGSKWASETSDEQWKGMRATEPKARSDLDASIAKHPTFAARRALMNLNNMVGHDEPPGATQLDLALKTCKASLQMNIKAVTQLRPRWGGSYAQMTAFAAKAPVALNPKLKVLPGTIAQDKCSLAMDRPAEALVHCEAALKVGPYWEFLFDKANLLMRLGRHQEALTALDLAIEQRPQKPRVHAVRAKALRALKRFDEAEAALALARSIDPYDPYLR